MKLALLNADDETLTLVRTLVAAGNELLLAAEPGEFATAVRAAAPGVRIVEEWENALACGAEATVVGRGGDEAERLDRIRRLVQEGMAAIVVHPQTTSALAYYELDMHRQATAAAIVPWEPSRHDPQLATLAAAGPGEEADDARIEQVICERRAADRSRRAVLLQFARDVGAIRRLTGECEKVSALGTLTDDPAAGHLGVQMTTAGGTLVRWSIGPAGRDDECSVEVIRGGTAETIAFDEQADSQPAAEAVIAALTDPDQTLWREALADLEIVEAVERSLRRGRTIELFHEEASEQGTFKGVMAAGGCLLLLVGIALAIAATIVGKFRLVIANAWPFALLAVLTLFLLLQLLRFAFPPKKR
jgi:myo-inositol 2-dehydrogenase/D-chiro-inositol 1-dehydrogenase